MAASPPTSLPQLSQREREVLDLIAQGKSNSEIAQALGLSFATVKGYVSSLLTKLGVEQREEAAVWWQRHGKPSRPSVFARWVRGLAPLGALKVAAYGVGGAVALAAGAGVVAIVVTAWPGDAEEAAEVSENRDGDDLVSATAPAAPLEPTPAADGSCPVAPIGAEMVRVMSGEAEVDGDGRPDEVIVYAVPSENTWMLRIELAAGGGFEQLITYSPIAEGSILSWSQPAFPAGGYDIDGDGREEVFVALPSGSYTTNLGVYVVDGCGATAATINGSPAILPVGFQANDVSGLRCTPGGLQHWSGTSEGGDTYQVVTEPLTLVGTALVAGRALAQTIPLDLPVTLDCEGLNADPYGPEPELGGHVIAVQPEHHGTIAAAETAPLDRNTPDGVCFEAGFEGLPAESRLLWFRLAIDGRDVTADLTWFLTGEDADGGIACYQPESRTQLANGFHSAAVRVTDPDAPGALPRQTVRWAFDVIPRDVEP